MKRELFSVFAGALVAAGAFGATEYFADAVNGNDSYDGLAAVFDGTHGPKLTLQAAIDVAQTGSTAANRNILTLLPGDYTNGVSTTSGGGSTEYRRGYVDSPLLIRSQNGRATRDTTRIVGEWDVSDPTNTTYPYGMGPKAVKCLVIGASNVRIEGITFYRGSCPYLTGSGSYTCGGAIRLPGNSATATVVDCAVRECQATRGGGLYSDSGSGGITAVRCLFKNNRCSKYGQATRGANCYWCVFDDNDGTRLVDGTTMGGDSVASSGACGYGGIVVNCTFVNNSNNGVGAVTADFANGIWNCLGMNNGRLVNANIPRYHNCVSDTAGMTSDNSVVTALYTSSEVCSPYDEDYRLIRNALSIGQADASYLDKIPEEFRMVDYLGNAVTADGGKVNCGAVQTAATETMSGINLSSDPTLGTWELDGRTVKKSFRTFVQRTGSHPLFHVKFTPVAGRRLAAYRQGQTTIAPLTDDSIWTTPWATGHAQTIQPFVAAANNIFWADATDGNDETGDGTEAKPYKSLQKAIDCAATNKHACICAKAGDYNSGTTNAFLSASLSRIFVGNVLNDIAWRILAVDGKESTFISGADGTGAEHGLGAGAVRCLHVAADKGFVCFQGFTIRHGRVYANGSSSNTLGAGLVNFTVAGSVRNTGWLADCDVVDCVGSRGGPAYGGCLIRCRVDKCALYNIGLFRKSMLYSSLVTGSYGSTHVLAEGSTAYNCTFASNELEVVRGPNETYAARGYAVNCVLGPRTASSIDVYAALEDGQLLNSLYGTAHAQVSPSALATDIQENPVLFAGAERGDWRLIPRSAGNRVGAFTSAAPPMDINGQPFDYDAEGRCVAGAFAALPERKLYVSPNGSDDNDGLAEATPYRTLAKALTEATNCFATVIALPGTYAEGSMLQTAAESTFDTAAAAPTLPSRAVIRNGVSLVSRDGAGTTFIAGEAVDGGCGPNAMRCAFVCPGGYLQGFTLTGGNTLGGDASTAITIDHAGGGVAGYYSEATYSARWWGLIENCIIANCHALRGAGGNYCTYRNCIFRANDNMQSKPGAAVRYARVEGCLFDGNGSVEEHSAVYCCEVVNCTVLANNAQASGAVLNENSDWTRKMINSVVLGARFGVTNSINCVFGSSTENRYGTGGEVNCVRADVKLDANGYPLAGSPVIDAGDATWTSDALLAGGDLAGGKRIWNGRIDAGAYEYDWRGDYGRVLGGKAVVTDAPSAATLDGRTLKFASGTVTVEWSPRQSGTQAFEYGIRVTGTGTLVVTVNGTATSYTSADGAQRLRFDSNLASNALSFTYEPGTNDEGGAELDTFRRLVGMLVLVR